MNPKIIELADAAAQKAVKEFYREMKKEESKKVLHNTWVLMEKYIEMKKHIIRAVSDDEGGVCLYSVRQSRTKTALMLENIDRAIEELRKEQSESGAKYKFDAFDMHFLQGETYEQICDVLDCGKNSPARWCKEMVSILSVKLFGVDGIDKW